MNPDRKELRKIKNQLRDLISPYYRNDDYCFFCWEKSSFKMTIHHRWYKKDDITYSKYPTTIRGRIRYYNDLLPFVKENPERFLYICNNCHNKLEYYLQFGNKLEDEIINELNKKFSKFQYLNFVWSRIAKFALRELSLDPHYFLHHKIDEKEYNHKSPGKGLDDLFWR